MDDIENLTELALVIGNGGPFNPTAGFKTVRDLVNKLISMGNSDHVLKYYNAHLVLKEELSPEFLNYSLDDINEQLFETEVQNVLHHASKILHYFNRVLTDDD